jgi:hypothetical protein
MHHGAVTDIDPVVFDHPHFHDDVIAPCHRISPLGQSLFFKMVTQ